MNSLVSVYKSGVASRHKTGDCSIEEIVEGVRDGRWSAPVERIRAIDDPVEKRKLKARILLAFTPTGVQSTESLHDGRCGVVRGSVQCTEGSQRRDTLGVFSSRTGLVAIDLDFYKGATHDPIEARNKLAASEHCVVAFVSVSGQAVKALVGVDPVPRSQDEHRKAWEGVCAWVTRELDLEPTTKMKDPPGNNIAHLQFVSFDPDAHIDLGKTPLPWKRWKATEGARRGEGYSTSVPTGARQREFTEENIHDMLNHCDVDGSWPDYRFKVARALRAWDNGGSRGRAIWLAWARLGTRSPHEDDYERSYDQVEGTGDSITVGTLVEFAREGGYLLVNRASRDGRDSDSGRHAHAGARDGGHKQPSQLSHHDIPRGIADHDAFAFSPLGAAHSLLARYADRIMIASEERQTRGIEYYPYLLDDKGVWQRESPWLMAQIGECVRDALKAAWAIMVDEGIRPEKAHRSALWSLAKDCGSLAFQKNALDVLYQAARHYPGVTWARAMELDRDPDHIACKNGVVYIGHDGPRKVAAPEARKHLLTMALPTEWHSDASEHRAVEKLRESYGEQWDWLVLYLGRQLHGQPGEMFLYIEGPHDSGKGTVVAALRGALGAQCGAIDAGVFAPKNGLPSSHNDATYPLVSSLIAVGDELGDSMFANRGGKAAELKRLTRGAATLLWFSGKSEKGMHRYLRAGILLIGNTRPYMNLTDPAMVKRFRIVKPKPHGTSDLSIRQDLAMLDSPAARDFLNRLIRAACKAQAGADALPEIENKDKLPDWMKGSVEASVALDSTIFDEWLANAVTKADTDDALGGVAAMHSTAMWERYCTDNGWKGGDKAPALWGGIRYKDALRVVNSCFGVEVSKTRIRINGVQASGWHGIVLRPKGTYSTDGEEPKPQQPTGADTEAEAKAKQDLEDERLRQEKQRADEAWMDD